MCSERWTHSSAVSSPSRNFTGVRKEYSHDTLTISGALADRHDSVVAVPPEYQPVDVGEAESVRCLKAGFWLVEKDRQKFAVLMAAHKQYGETAGIQFQAAATAQTGIVEQFYRRLEDAVAKSCSYRGKVLSLESGRYHSSAGADITVQRLAPVSRDQVILPPTTVELLERNVVRFCRSRAELARRGQAVRKGVLFYGPPGTGKTHTIRWLAGDLPGHTTLLITGEQVGLLSEYMSLARLLAPSIVVVEDVDLIAKERTRMGGPCEEAMLNKLLNEMDGLAPEAEILFILTTNRPEELEPALASRPGRVDQAVEFPLPDADGRAKLVRLYAGKLEITNELTAEMVRRTDHCSAAFIKELMRRTAQFLIERGGDVRPESRDVDAALNEMLFVGGSLNVKLLGGVGTPA
jgi:hypothetical protein